MLIQISVAINEYFAILKCILGITKDVWLHQVTSQPFIAGWDESTNRAVGGGNYKKTSPIDIIYQDTLTDCAVLCVLLSFAFSWDWGFWYIWQVLCSDKQHYASVSKCCQQISEITARARHRLPFCFSRVTDVPSRCTPHRCAVCAFHTICTRTYVHRK